MLDVIKMARWLNIARLQSEARSHAISVSTRWDIVQGRRKPDQDPSDPELYVEVEPGVWKVWPHDLRDTRGRSYRTAPDAEGKQGRISSRVLADDLKDGSASPAIPLLFAAVPVLALLISLFHFLPVVWLVPSTPLVVVLALIATATDSKQWAGSALIAAALPLASLAMGRSGSSEASFPSMSLVAIGLPVAVLVTLALLFGGLRQARLVIGGIVIIAIMAAACALLPQPLWPLVLALPGCALPAFWAFTQKQSRAVMEAFQGKEFTWEDSPNGTYHIESRRVQTLRAAKGQA